MPAGTCRECGCTETTPCVLLTPVREMRCSWVEVDLCSACTPSQRGIGWEHPPRSLPVFPTADEAWQRILATARHPRSLARIKVDPDGEWQMVSGPELIARVASIEQGAGQWVRSRTEDGGRLLAGKGAAITVDSVWVPDAEQAYWPSSADVIREKERAFLLPVGGVWDGPASTENATETEDPMEAGLDAGGETPEMREDRNERERDAERSAPHRKSTSERIAGAEEIPHTPEQAERAAAGTRAGESKAVTALRRLVGFLLTTNRASLAYNGDIKAMVVVDAVRTNGATFDPGDVLIDYDECEAIKDLLEQLVTDEAMRGKVGNVAFHPDDLRDALRRLDRITQLANEANAGPPTKKRFREALTSIRNLATGHTNPPTPDEDTCRIENVALRAEVDRLRRDREVNLKITEDLQETLTSRDGIIDRLGSSLETMGGEVRTLLHHLDGSDGMPAAWWLEAGRAAARLQGMVGPQGSDSPRPPADGAGSLRPVPGRRGGRVH